MDRIISRIFATLLVAFLTLDPSAFSFAQHPTGTDRDRAASVGQSSEDTQTAVNQVYGPPAPAGSEEEIVSSPPKGEHYLQELLEKQKEKEIAQAQDLEKKLVKERKKLKSFLKKQKAKEETVKPAKPTPKELEPIRLPAEAATKELLKVQKVEKKHYGMTLAELSTRWGALREKIQGPNSPVGYKQLTKQEKQVVNSKVRFEREEERRRMPILDKAYFNEVITRDILIARENFARGVESKTLGEAVERALEVYLPIQVAYEKERAAKMRALKAFRDLFAEANFELQYKNGELSGAAATGSAFKSESERLNFKQPVFRGGNLWNTFREERANFKAAVEEVVSTRTDLIRDVAEAYMAFSRAQTLFRDKSELAAKSETFKAQNEEKKKADVISEIEYLNTDSLIGEIKADLETAYQELALAQVDLSKFLNLARDQKLEVESIDSLKGKIVTPEGEPIQISVTSGKEAVPSVSQELDQMINRAYQNRADLRLEEFKLLANRYKEKAVFGQLLPQADFIIEVGQLREAFIQIDKTPPFDNEFKIGFEVSQNLFGNTAEYSFDATHTAPSVTAFQGGGGTRPLTHKFTMALLDGLQQFVDAREARVEMMEQMLELKEKENEVIKEVKEAYYGYHKALIQLDSAVKKLEHKDRVAKLKAYQLERNQVPISEYLQAEKDWIDAKNQYTDAVSEYYVARISLNRAVGEKDLLRLEGFPFSRKEREQR